MPLEALLAALRRRPFAPFRLYLGDGQSYEVHHPEMMIPARRGYAAVGVPAAEEPAVAERIDTVALLHIVRLEPLEAQTPAAGDGQH